MPCLDSRMELDLVVEVAGEVALRACEMESQWGDQLRYVSGPDPGL